MKYTLFYVAEEPNIGNERLEMKLFEPERTRSKVGRYYKVASIDNDLIG